MRTSSWLEQVHVVVVASQESADRMQRWLFWSDSLSTKWKRDTSEGRILSMLKALRRVIALFALVAVAVKGVFSFLSWVEKQDDLDASVWIDEEELEEVQ
jgi:nitrate reductase NapE component